MNKIRKLKASIFAAFLVGIAVIIILAHISSVSPLAKWIDVGLYCRETEDPIPDGLAVRLVGQGYDVIEKTVGGNVLFGSGLVDGQYLISWYWNEPYERAVEINCSKITWNFDFCVPNPTITKHFRYDTPYNDYPPVSGLNVTLQENGADKTWQLTDATGTVTFDGQYINVCSGYDLTWSWGGKPYSVGPIHFGYENNQLLVCAWEETNYLPAKSGGDNHSG